MRNLDFERGWKLHTEREAGHCFTLCSWATAGPTTEIATKRVTRTV